MRFEKYEGLGNDFIVVDLTSQAVSPSPLEPEIARKLCDRHFGIGADGVLAILPPREGGDARMIVKNADGSDAEMCGNGLRCVVKALYDGTHKKPVLVIETGAGALACAVTAGPDARARAVTVDMGRPRTDRTEIPMLGTQGRVIDEVITAGDRTFAITAVSMGNPHAVAFIDDARADLCALATLYGPRIEAHSAFPRRTNVEFARISEDAKSLELWVWERGCGITLACGTGACATVVAGVLAGRLEVAREIRVNLPGGALDIEVARDLSNVTMRGPARLVYRGEIAMDE